MERILFAPPEGAGGEGAQAVAMAGDLDGWRAEVAAPAVGNSRLAFSISFGFSGPLQEVAGEASGGVQLTGGSSTGKTTCARGAASVWGPPVAGGALRTWKATANGMEAAAAACSDGLLVLDELKEAEPREVAGIIYALGNESGKARMTQRMEARARKTWRLQFLSTGEVDPATVAAEDRRRLPAGADVRLPSVPADAGAGLGCWQELHGHADGQAFALAIEAGARRHHGHAARAFVERLAAMRAADPTELERAVKASQRAFCAAHVPKGANGQVGRVAKRFALVATAGELAIAFGVVPWPEGEAERAAAECLRAWLQQRGGAGAAEAAEYARRLRDLIGRHGAARFEDMGDDDEGGHDMEGEDSPSHGRLVINRAGWRDCGGDGRWHHYVLPEVWHREVFAGMDGRAAARALEQRCWLRRDGSHLCPKVTVPGIGSTRLFHVLPALFGEDDETDREGEGRVDA